MDIKKFFINLLTLLSTPIYLLLIVVLGVVVLAYKVGDALVDLTRTLDRNNEVRLC